MERGFGSGWVTQQGRKLAIEARLAPKVNAFAERFVRTVRSECLDLRRRHLELVLRTYLAHYVQERQHRGLALATPSGCQ